jgi:hypothetical protein
MRYTLKLTLIVLITLSVTPVSFAKKGGNGGGKPPPPPPEECTDDFPGFSYEVEATRRAPAEIWLSSTDGCRTERIAVQPEGGLLRGGPFHMTADRSKGLLIWTERILAEFDRYIVWRQDFTEDSNGDWKLEGLPVQLLPLPEEEVLPEEAYLDYAQNDIWGDATHDALYLVTTRLYMDNVDSPEAIEELLIFNLNDMTDVREIFRSAQAAGEWTCPDPDYPQFVPTCYRPQTVRFNPSGTRLYISDSLDDTQDERWNGTIRINIDRFDGTVNEQPLAKWRFSGPELISTGGGGGLLARPAADRYEEPPQELIPIRDGLTGLFQDADQCALDYAHFADGTVLLTTDFWRACLDDESVWNLSSYLHGGGDSWQSPDSLLFSLLGKRHYDIYRRYITGELAGTEQLLVENARGADTGY